MFVALVDVLVVFGVVRGGLVSFVAGVYLFCFCGCLWWLWSACGLGYGIALGFRLVCVWVGCLFKLVRIGVVC